MIEVLRYPECTLADKIEDRLQTMTAAYKTRIVDRNQRQGGTGLNLPAVRENGKIISGRKQIDRFLVQLEKDIKKWNRFTGDYCYLDDDGEIC
jgi:hypothetical protein